MSERIVPQLGDLVIDLVTDVEGVVIAITHHLAASSTAEVQLKNCADGNGNPRPGRSYQFPLDRLTVKYPGWALPEHLRCL